MSAWRRKALEFLPAYKFIIEQAENPMSLWGDLRFEFDKLLEQGDIDALDDFHKYARWCISDHSGKLPTEASSAAIVSFYEDLANNKASWKYFKKWFFEHEFNMLLPHFRYLLEEEELESLIKVYRNS